MRDRVSKNGSLSPEIQRRTKAIGGKESVTSCVQTVTRPSASVIRLRLKPQARSIRYEIPRPTVGPPGAIVVEAVAARVDASAARYRIPGRAAIREGP